MHDWAHSIVKRAFVGEIKTGIRQHSESQPASSESCSLALCLCSVLQRSWKKAIRQNCLLAQRCRGSTYLYRSGWYQISCCLSPPLRGKKTEIDSQRCKPDGNLMVCANTLLSKERNHTRSEPVTFPYHFQRCACQREVEWKIKGERVTRLQPSLASHSHTHCRLHTQCPAGAHWTTIKVLLKC